MAKPTLCRGVYVRRKRHPAAQEAITGVDVQRKEGHWQNYSTLYKRDYKLGLFLDKSSLNAEKKIVSSGGSIENKTHTLQKVSMQNVTPH